MLALALSAELNGYILFLSTFINVYILKAPSLTNLRPLDTEEQPFHYTFTVQCTSCREEHPKWVTLTRFVLHHISIDNNPSYTNLTLGKESAFRQ